MSKDDIFLGLPTLFYTTCNKVPCILCLGESLGSQQQPQSADLQIQQIFKIQIFGISITSSRGPVKHLPHTPPMFGIFNSAARKIKQSGRVTLPHIICNRKIFCNSVGG